MLLFKQKELRAALTLLVAQVFFGQALADGTPAGTTVSNQASVSFAVGGVTQTPVLSDDDGNPANGAGATQFLVDRKIDVNVAETSAAYNSATTPNVFPGMQQGAGATGAVLGFTLTNEGNQVQDFLLSAAPTTTDPHGGADNFDAANLAVFVDANANGLYDPAIDTAVFADELAIDASVTVFVVGDIPVSQVDGDIAAYLLSAQAAEGGTAASAGAAIVADDAGAADDPATVQDVFADGENSNNAGDAVGDGIHSSEDAFRVSAATLSVAKSSTVISDPFTCPGGVCPGGSNPKAIPGAIVEYAITVANAAGAATADNLVISDDLSAEIVGGGGSESIDFLADEYGGSGDIELTFTPNAGAPTVSNLTQEADADTGQFAANVVSVSAITLAAGDQAVVRFRVEIQ